MAEDKPSTVADVVRHVQQQFSRIYLGGIPALLNDQGAYLSFIVIMAGTEGLARFYRPKAGNGERFKEFVRRFYPEPLAADAEKLWELRNSLTHAFSSGPYALTHHRADLHWSLANGLHILNAENMYAALLAATEQYFNSLLTDTAMQASFVEAASDAKDGILIVSPIL